MGASGKPDFEAVAAAALSMAHVLLPQWLGGKREGHEWVGERKANGGLGDSWKVNLTTGAFAHFAGDERGGDLVSLYAALNHLNQGAACEQVAALVGVSDRPVAVLNHAKPTERPAEPIPADAPDPMPHSQYGKPSAIYRYGSAFWVCRYDHADGKDFRQFTWRGGKWHARGYGDERPLYGAELLAKYPTAPVILVEGEKACEALRRVMSAYVVITWAGGANAVKESDWTSLQGREVIIWPDADAPGAKAGAQLATMLPAIADTVRVINPNDQPDGWDAADAIAEGWDAKQIADWATEHIRSVDASAKTNGAHSPTAIDEPSPPDAEYLAATERNDDYPMGSPPRSAMTVWKDIGLAEDGKQIPHVTLANASLILRFHPNFKGQIWYDSFRERIYHTLRGPAPKEWNDIDSSRIATFMQQQMKLPKFTLRLVQDAVIHAAHEDARDSVQDWLGGLKWDGHERLSTWVGDCLGVALDAYSMAVARNWIISMVARAYKPGCQVDTMPVLEGLQGEGKSSALEIIGGQWFAAVGTTFGSYDFIQTIQGKWLIEIPDMAGFGRREHSHVIATITTRTDRYRMKYGRFDEDHPRKCVFAATSETDDYLPEMRGYRRYWPLRCTEIDLNTLREQREQLFAEAVFAWRNGESFHRMPADLTADEQRSRAYDDLWTEDVLAYCEPRALAGHPVYPAKILTDSALELKRKDMDQSAKLRVVNILKAHGWHHKMIDNKHQYVRPKRKSDPIL